jgi:uncharacterized protein
MGGKSRGRVWSSMGQGKERAVLSGDLLTPGLTPGTPAGRGFYLPAPEIRLVTEMLTSHRLLQQYWHDDRYDPRQVRVWYIDRGAPDDRSIAEGSDISLEPYYLSIRTPAGEKPVPYHRILVITYAGAVVFENRKVGGLGDTIAGNVRDMSRCDP